MSRTVRHRPSPAFVVACLALLVSLGGTSYAVTALPAKSVGTKQLKNRAVTNPKIGNNAVTGAKVKADSLSGPDISETTLATVPSATTADKATTADRATAADSAGVANSLAKGDVNVATALNADGAVSAATATCDAGLKGVSAGVQVTDPANQYVIDLFPVGLDSWTARVTNSGTGGNFTVFVICAPVNAVTF